MQTWFRRALRMGGVYFVTFFISIFLGAGFPDGSFFSGVGVGLVAALFCTTPFLLLFMMVTGIGTLIERNSSPEKRKRDWSADFYSSDDQRLRQILSRLSADDRAFLEAKLAERSLGLHDDGEIVSLDDLLDEDSRKRYR